MKINILEIKNVLNNYLGMNLTLKCNLGRNKYENLKCKLNNIYSNVFTVTTDKNELKSFSYADIITKTIKLSINGKSIDFTPKVLYN
jgi:uncharacterized protein Veg